MNTFDMDPEFVEYLKTFKAEEKKRSVPGLLKNLEERSLGFTKKNVASKEYRELIAEELLVKKETFDELRCEMPGIPRSTFLMVFSPDGTKAASTHGNHNIYVTDIRSGKNITTLTGHPRTPWCIAFHPISNQIIASGCLGGQVRIWDLSGGSEVWTAKNQTVIASIAFHPIARVLVIATSNEVYFWDWSKPEPFMHTTTASQKEKVRYVAFDKLGQRLITGISNSHSRWEYVRSSERSTEHPVRHFNIASRRPVFRRGLFPVRQSVYLSSASNDPSESRSRVPERERNITMSYRNLVRQYGRLVQRYLQLYRPPAMIDRGTDPMENTAASSTTEVAASTSTAEITASNTTPEVTRPSSSAEAGPSSATNDAQVSNETSQAAETTSTVEATVSSGNVVASGSSLPVEAVAANDNAATTESELQESDESFQSDVPSSSTGSTPSGNNRQVDPRRYIDILHDPVRCLPPSASVLLSRKHKNVSSPQHNIPQKRMKFRRDNAGEPSTSRSESPQPSTSGASDEHTYRVRELSTQILTRIANIVENNPNVVMCEIVRSNNGASGTNQRLTIHTDEFETNQPSTDNYDDLVVDVTEHYLDQTFENTSSDDEEPSVPTTDQEPSNSTEQHPENVSNSQECTGEEEVVENSSDNNQVQTENTTEVQPVNSPSVEVSTPGTSANNSEGSTDPDVERIYRQMIRSLDSPSGEILRSRLNEVSDAATSQSVEEPQDVGDILDDSLNATDPVPGPSGASGLRLLPGDDRRLENMMMNMRRKAEDNLRARLMPLIRSRIPENERDDLLRLFEASIRESRERARMRYRLMVQMYNRQSNREHPFTSSDSSSSDEGRDPLQMNFHVRSRTDNNSRTATNDPAPSSSRSPGHGFSSGNSSYQNINNLESWVTSLFNDVQSLTAISNEVGIETLRRAASRPLPTNNSADLLPRMNSGGTARQSYNLNDSISSLSTGSTLSPANSPSVNSVSNANGTNSASPSTTRRRLTNTGSAFSATGTEPEARRDEIGSGIRRHAEALSIRLPSNPTTDSSFARDEVINFSELPNSENPAPERSESFNAPLQASFHPFNPPPNLPAINPENIGIGNMYSNIIRDLETSLNSARHRRTADRPGEMSNMLRSFSQRLETLMNQSEGILRNLRTTVEVLPDNDGMEFGEDPPVPTVSFNDSSFFVRDQAAERANSERNATGYDIRQNNATSDHTYPRNSDSPSASSNVNGGMSPLMNSLHLTLSHIQTQSRLLHTQVESIERIDRAMVEVSQIQLMRLLLGELSTYVRNMSGESRSTGMSSVRQMMAGTRISDASPANTQNSGNSGRNATNPRPTTSSGSRSSNQSSSARSRGLFRKTYPPSRMYRPLGQSYSRNPRDVPPPPTDSSTLPSVAPPHTFSVINMPTLVRMERRLQSVIDDHSTRFSYLTDQLARNNNSPRRLVHELGEHNVALRLRESITRTNRLLGNIFNSNIIRNYRIDATTSLRHGINRYYERTFLSLIIDGISIYLDDNREYQLLAEVRTRLLSVLQLAMMLADLLLLYTIISLGPSSEVNAYETRRLASRISETCSGIIRSRRNSNVFAQSLRSLRLMVGVYAESPATALDRNLDTRADVMRLFNALRDRELGDRVEAEFAAAENLINEDDDDDDDEDETGPDNRYNAFINESMHSSSRPSPEPSNSSGPNQPNIPPNRQNQREPHTREGTLYEAVLYLSRQRALVANNASNTSQNEDNNTRSRRRNSTDSFINAILSTGRFRHLNRSNANQSSENESQQNTNRNSSVTDNRRNRSGFNPYRDMALITSRSTDPLSATGSSQASNRITTNRNLGPRGRGRLPMLRGSNAAPRSEEQNSERGRDTEPQERGSSSDFNSWLHEPFPVEPAQERSSFLSSSNESRVLSNLSAPLSPIQRPSTSNNADSHDHGRYWRIPSVQVNDVPVSDLAPPLDNSDSDNSTHSGLNSGNSTYPRVMARLAAIRSQMPHINPMGVLRPRLLHPLYSFENDLDQREQIYDNDVISTITPNHRIQVWELTTCEVPNISDPLKNVVVRECKIHNDASVDIASDGSILVTLLPSGGYLNITNRLGIYSLKWETLGQCLYTTSFVHNAVSVSLSPLGRHLVVALASRRISILPNDRWMMASIYKIEEKDTRGEHLPFVRQIERGRNEPTSHKSVNCIRWLPTSGQGLIYATNTGQLNIWT